MARSSDDVTNTLHHMVQKTDKTTPIPEKLCLFMVQFSLKFSVRVVEVVKISEIKS
jgi:hypothetical protein